VLLLNYQKNRKEVFKMKKRLFLIGIFVILIFSCIISNAHPWKKKSSSVNNLKDTSWQLVTLKEKNVGSITVDDNSKISVSFTNNRISGFSGVNRYSGGYKLSNDSISISQLSVNLMSGSRSAMDVEDRFLRILGSAKKVKQDKDTLTLENSKGDTLTFRSLKTSENKEQNSALPLNKEILNTEWKLVDMAGRTLKNHEDVTIAFTEDGVNGNSGVNNYFSSYKIKDNNITIGVLSSTRMAGPENLMKLERDFSQYIQNVKKIRLLDKNTLVLTTGNGKNLTFKKIR
jgi:hypothetical protein